MDVEISDMVETDKDLNVEDILERELRSVSSSEAVPQNKDTNIHTDFKTLETTKQRLRQLEIVYNSLCTIQPPSVEAERAFSAYASILTKIQSRMGDVLLDALAFLKSYYWKTSKK